jgi:hypothetical protein
MPSLREHLRRALAAKEPSPSEAKRDLERVLSRAKHGAERKPKAVPWSALVPVLAVAAGVAFYLRGRAGPDPSVADRGVHLYVHLAGEPESQALAFDVDPHGEP